MNSKTPWTIIFWVRGKCGPDRWLFKSEASSKTDAFRRGKAFAKANDIRFMDARPGHDSVPPSIDDALSMEGCR